MRLSRFIVFEPYPNTFWLTHLAGSSGEITGGESISRDCVAVSQLSNGSRDAALLVCPANPVLRSIIVNFYDTILMPLLQCVGMHPEPYLSPIVERYGTVVHLVDIGIVRTVFYRGMMIANVIVQVTMGIERAKSKSMNVLSKFHGI